MLLLFSTLLICTSIGGIRADSKIPIIGNYNNQIRLNIGDHLRLECPVHGTGSDNTHNSGGDGSHALLNDDNSGVLYHWRVRDQLDYALDMDSRYRFTQNRRVLEVTAPLESSDSGIYTCMGITGFGKREVSFEVHVRDPDENLLCATSTHPHQNIKAPCFIDPLLKKNPVITVEEPLGSTVKLNCEADGTEPIRYRWFMGNTVADWITTGQGTRGPVLTIERIGREHIGHYTCQVTNVAGSLNYTYRLVVTELPSARPKIISAMQNHTFSSDTTASLVARIHCACEEPVIQDHTQSVSSRNGQSSPSRMRNEGDTMRYLEVKLMQDYGQLTLSSSIHKWLKRVEPGEEQLYAQSGATRIPLPNARESEKDEIFVVLGSWAGSPAVIDKTVSHIIDPQLSETGSHTMDPNGGGNGAGMHSQHGTYGSQNSGPYYGRSKSNPFAQAQERIFVTRMQLQKPLEKKRHQGKYIVMTMSLADVKSMEYAVIYVEILQDPTIMRMRRILLYFLVPFGLLFAMIGIIAYLFACRRRRSGGRSVSSSNERCILRTAEVSPQAYQVMANGKKPPSLNMSSKHSSNSQANEKQSFALLGVQSPFMPHDDRSMTVSNGFDHPVGIPENPNRTPYFGVGLPQSQTSVATPANSLIHSNVGDNMSSAMTGPGAVISMNGMYLPSSNPSQRNLPFPPVLPSSGDVHMSQQNSPYFVNYGGVTVPPSSAFEGLASQSRQPPPQQFGVSQPNATLNVQMAPSSATEISFDQYSAVSQSPLSSSTLTNHYTAPFNDFARARGPDGAESMVHTQASNYPRA
ncbi:unnamed protein product [Calicophoron daubneyi]|uniref:Ig-like domain-containing protein n=1 Tax=Calicophoron daubneyi TaxID=300641 RepID=A0AAV2TME7_CALDB